jgi:hypothetical protein
MERTQIEPAREAPPGIHLVEIYDAFDGVLEGYTTPTRTEETLVYAAGMGTLTLDEQLTTPAGAPYRAVRIGDGDHATVYVFGAVSFPVAHAYGLLLLLARRLDDLPAHRPFATLQLYREINLFADDSAVRVLLRDLAPKPAVGEPASAYAARLRQSAENL